MRKLFVVCGFALIVAAAFLVPMPLFEVAPGATIDAQQHVAIQNINATPVSGRILLTSVLLSQPSFYQTVEDLIASDNELVARSSVVPPGVDADTYRVFQRRLFEESGETAAAVAFRAAGHNVSITGNGAAIIDVVRGGPADGVLQPGDVVIEANGEPVQLSTDLARVTSSMRPGQELTLRIRRGDATLTTSVNVGRLEQRDRPRLGVIVDTVDRRVDLPTEVKVDVTDVGGPSGGLMFALTIYDLVSVTDVAANRVIAGTGTLDNSGRVGPVGGVKQKVRAAIHAGAHVFIAPADNADDARDAARNRLTVVSVQTFDEALRALTVA